MECLSRLVGFCSSVATPTSPAAAFEEAPARCPSPGRSGLGAPAPIPPGGAPTEVVRADGRVRRAISLTLAWLCAIAGLASLAAPAALANESCPNEASRQGPSVNLPECRVYEQVTPVNKGDTFDIFASSGQAGLSPASGNAAFVAEGGEAVLLHARASFGPQAPVLEAAYLFSREADGWKTGILSQPIDEPQYSYESIWDPSDLSAIGFTSLSGTFDELLNGEASKFAETQLVGPVGGPYHKLFSVSGFNRFNFEEKVELAGGSEDLSRVVLESTDHSLAPGASSQASGSMALYETTGGECNADETSACKLIDVNEKGEAMPCGASIGKGQSEQGDGGYSAVSNDGSKIFFTAPEPEVREFQRPVATGPGCWKKPAGGLLFLENPPRPQENPPQLYMREDGMRTVKISKPEEGVQVGTVETPELPAVFVGASIDGSKVFFMTRMQLTKGAVGHYAELYEYETDSGTLKLISGGETGTAVGRVENVDAIPADGSAVYFSALGKLTKEAGEYEYGGVTSGGPYSPINLYRYDTVTGTTTFIATLNQYDYPEPLSAGETINEHWYELEFGLTGTVHPNLDSRKVWYTTADGQFLLFGSVVPLTGFDNQGHCGERLGEGPGGIFPCIELFRYDANAAEHKEPSIVCISCAGGTPVDDASFTRTGVSGPATGTPRPISENGEDVFFDDASALVPQATPGKVHVYEWHDGVISLISSPNDTGNAFFLGSSREGRDVILETHAELAPADTDQAGDIYDARVDGGFAGLTPPQCTGTGCQGVPAAPPIFATPASVTFEGVGNFAPGSEESGPPPPRESNVKATRCKHGYVKSRGRCVKRRVKKVRRARRPRKGRK